MKWRSFLGVGSKALPIWAALCTGRADGSDQKYPAQTKHAILAMVRAQESDAENAICSLLQSKGWGDPTIQKLKKLDQPFHSVRRRVVLESWSIRTRWKTPRPTLSWRNIPMSLINPQKGETNAHTCANAWFRQLDGCGRIMRLG